MHKARKYCTSTEQNRRVEYFENHLDGEDGGEHVVEHFQEVVAPTGTELGVLDRVLGRERHGARADHDHYEYVEVAQVHDEVAEAPDAMVKRSAVVHCAMLAYTVKYEEARVGSTRRKLTCWRDPRRRASCKAEWASAARRRSRPRRPSARRPAARERSRRAQRRGRRAPSCRPLRCLRRPLYSYGTVPVQYTRILPHE